MQSSIFRDAELVFLRNQHADAISALSALDSQFAQLDKEKSIMASKIQQVGSFNSHDSFSGRLEMKNQFARMNF